METVHQKTKKFCFAIEDRSYIPKDLMANILDRMPMKDAVKTSVLSRDWRVNWTMRTKLIFDEDFFRYLKTKFCNELLLLNYTRIINRAFLHHRGPISKFVLYIPGNEYGEMDTEDINQWILFLSANGIEEFTLENKLKTAHKLPAQIFSCLELTHLKLHRCCLHPTPAFRGFPNLRNLEFHQVSYITSEFEAFVSSCPLLERLTMEDMFIIVKLKSIDMEKLQNLKVLSLSIFHLVGPMKSANMIQVMGSLPKLEELCLDFFLCMSVAEVGVTKNVHTTFQGLKILELSGINFNSSFDVLCALCLLRGSPNLQKLEISVLNGDLVQELGSSSWEEDCTVRRLRTVKIGSITGSKHEMSLIKFLLACSPLLEKMNIYYQLSDEDHGLKNVAEISSELMKFSKASPKAEIDLTDYSC